MGDHLISQRVLIVALIPKSHKKSDITNWKLIMQLFFFGGGVTGMGVNVGGQSLKVSSFLLWLFRHGRLWQNIITYSLTMFFGQQPTLSKTYKAKTGHLTFWELQYFLVYPCGYCMLDNTWVQSQYQILDKCRMFDILSFLRWGCGRISVNMEFCLQPRECTGCEGYFTLKGSYF